MSDKIKVGIIGAGGYGGCGAIEILCNHPHVEIKALMAKHDTGRPISDLYPHLTGFCDLPVLDAGDPNRPDDFDVVFFATPDGVGQKDAPNWLKKGAKVIDYSGDFRFNDLEIYKGYAARIGKPQEHASPELLPRAVYGLAEFHRPKIAAADLVGNPGCFAVSCNLGLAPAVKEGLIEQDSIICDAKTGISGAGKTPTAAYHYPARYDAINAYKISGHQHVYEIERQLSLQAGTEIKITFTPHAVPLCRGILSTLYATLKPGQNIRKVLEAYREFYKNDVFVRVFGPEKPQISTNVRGSNFCNLSVNVDDRTAKLIVVSLIDNLLKGQAGSAVQNMNIMFGLDEAAGLMHPGMYP
ncbi:N-acetyl-gamma-glutamyl-phosphate reductase [uncultured Desulfobacterium sp.]|uniref:N-acetyl-gamma-glutamyl-phosphate reductase n=1 Tax=uncultured Desulfobacterium sp. TaxID=201089 RepID=A0A445MX06_9BACT|nr:N-acetyl-gamma-glutamyl-phosphate reductase [uncultured Desulfobacterium sp.]